MNDGAARQRCMMSSALAAPSPTTLPIRIVHIDDDEEEHVIVSRLLSALDDFPVELTWVGSFEAGLAAVSRNAADIFLVDYRLGERTGLELIAEARRQGAARPVVLLTGHGSREIDLRAMALGVADYLEKGSLTGNLLQHSVRCTLRQWVTMTALKESYRARARAQDQLEQERAALARTSADLAATRAALAAQHRQTEAPAHEGHLAANACGWLPVAE